MPVVLGRHTGPDVALFPDCLVSMGSRHFPLNSCGLGRIQVFFLTKYLWDWQGSLGISFAFLPEIIVRYIMYMYFSELCFVPGNRSLPFTSHKEQLHLEKYGQD